ncbi:LOW QUALITY PROTEIN: hypothetical protein MAR_021607 [Mya arenaria]|uniref:Uncharacterized protein n=1 Tax=Mya arenaria TaxID=6604 RepID=A0ABY7E8D1_MYAAR|nr:LOW QUALITY PROTEIN: hypothetical protein MAR_021607 [Mya arenaria]
MMTRVQKHRQTRMVNRNNDDDLDEMNDSSSGYGTQESLPRQLIIACLEEWAKEEIKSKPKRNSGILTPRRKTALFMKSSEIKGEKAGKRLLFCNVLLHHMKSEKGDRGRNTSLYSTIAGDVIKKYKCISKLAVELDVNRNKLSEVYMNGVKFAKIRRRRVILKLQESVTKFFEREDNCRIQPEGKVQIRVLTDYLANLHQKYEAELPDNK